MKNLPIQGMVNVQLQQAIADNWQYKVLAKAAELGGQVLHDSIVFEGPEAVVEAKVKALHEFSHALYTDLKKQQECAHLVRRATEVERKQGWRWVCTVCGKHLKILSGIIVHEGNKP